MKYVATSQGSDVSCWLFQAPGFHNLHELQLRGQRDTIEGLVDEVVQGYHNGFNKAIHNYSQILQLFSNCKTHVNTLRSSLEQAKVQLGSQSRSLQQQVNCIFAFHIRDYILCGVRTNKRKLFGAVAPQCNIGRHIEASDRCTVCCGGP